MSDRHHKVTSINLKWEDHFDEVGRLPEKEGIKEKTTRMLTSRRNRGCGQSIFVALVLVTLVYGCYLYFDLKKSLEETRDRAVRYQQQQESLTGQLQVVYEHRTRLEKALQESKSETKRVKEESQRKFELEQQEASNKYNALNIQHKMLKSQNEDIKEELDDVRQRERKAIDEKERTSYELEANITRLRESFEVKKQFLAGQIETLKAETELGQGYLLQLHQVKQQLEKSSQERSILTARLIANEQLISASEKEKVFLQNQVDTFSRQVQSLKLQLEQANVQKNLVPKIPLSNVQNNPPNNPPNNQQVPEVQQNIIDPYEQQRLAFDKQRQQDLLGKRYVQQQNVYQGANQQPVVMQQVPQQAQQVIQQQPVAQQDPIILKQIVPAVPQNNQPEGKDINRNVNLHLEKGNIAEKAEAKDDSDYGDSDGNQQGVVLKHPEMAAEEAREQAVHNGDQKAISEDNRLPDAKKPNEEDEDSEKEQDKDSKDDDDDEPLWRKGNQDEDEDEQNEDEKMQALQEKQLEEDLRREEKAEEDENIAMHPPGNYQENERNEDDDAPAGLVVDVRRDEVEEHIEEEEGLRKQQQLQLQARAQQAGEEDKDEDSNYDKAVKSASEHVEGLQRKFGVHVRDHGENDQQNPDEGEGDQHHGLERPEIDDAQMNNVINNPPVLDHPAEVEANQEDDKIDRKKFNQEMR